MDLNNQNNAIHSTDELLRGLRNTVASRVTVWVMVDGCLRYAGLREFNQSSGEMQFREMHHSTDALAKEFKHLVALEDSISRKRQGDIF